jgi:uncharacterized protein
MGQHNQRLDHLDHLMTALLAEIKPMTVSVLDGFVTGVLACPEMIQPQHWLSQVWGTTGVSNFKDRVTAEEAVMAAIAHYGFVREELMRSLTVKPVFGRDPSTGKTLWQPWVDGFTRAMSLSPDSWTDLLDKADEETWNNMAFLMALQDIATGQSTLSGPEVEETDSEAPRLIPDCVAIILHRSRSDLAEAIGATLPGSAAQNAGSEAHNDPCACGSGYVYKLCCGHH